MLGEGEGNVSFFLVKYIERKELYSWDNWQYIAVIFYYKC